MIKFLIEKEFKQLFRNFFIARLIFVFPVVMMILLPLAANMEIKNVYLNIVDNDHSAFSERLVRKIAESNYFRLNGVFSSYDEAMKSVEEGTADVIMEIHPDFEKNLMQGKNGQILLAANTVNGTKGNLGSSYLAAIINQYAMEFQSEHPQSTGTVLTPKVNVATQNRYNPNLDYKYFIVPAIMVMLLTLLCGFLPALNIVSEKETGTIEQINVTPVNKFIFILAKLLPYWCVGFIILTICLGLAWLFYGILPVGNVLIIYLFATVFILTASGLGLVISNKSSTMQQAMFVMFFFLIILMIMSGMYTPIASMPQWAQIITIFNPLKYFIEVMRMVYLKGSHLGDLLPQLWALIAFALFLNSWAVISYKKNS